MNVHHFAPNWMFKLKYCFMMGRMTPEHVVEMACEHLLPYKGHDNALVCYMETKMGWDATFLDDPTQAAVVICKEVAQLSEAQQTLCLYIPDP